jgi:hypothetical protein
MEEVGLTSESWTSYDEHDQDSLLEAALEWLETNKPKSRHTFGESGEGAGLSNAGSGADAGHGSPGLTKADVEGEEDDGVAVSHNRNGSGRKPAVRNGLSLPDAGSESEKEEDKKQGREDATSQAKKRQRTSVSEGLVDSANRRERRAEEQLQNKQKRQEEKERRRGERERTPPPKGVGRSKAAELEAHRRSTRQREKARRNARELVGEALKQQKRSKAGANLTADEQELAAFAKTLSPVKLLGAGFRLQTDQDEDIVLSEDEDAIEELMEETGCEREHAQEALDRSCDWTASGRPSRLKAARWLMEQLEESSRTEGVAQVKHVDSGRQDENSDVEVIGHQSPGGTLRPAGRRTQEEQQRSAVGGNVVGQRSGGV